MLALAMIAGLVAVASMMSLPDSLAVGALAGLLLVRLLRIT
jgi:hypothetical protein